MWIDAHNHLQDPRQAATADGIVASLRAAGIDGCVVNGSNPGDWEAVADLARRFPGFVRPAFGLHPWEVRQVAAGWQEDLLAMLAAFPDAGVGEIGLDRWIAEPRIERQIAAFRWQWEQAVAGNRPVSVHCLKAWGLLIDQLATLPPHPGRVLVHGFGGSAEVAARLVKHGCYLGFNGYFLRPGKERVVAVFAALPEAHLLVESDAPDMAPPPPWRTHAFADPRLNHPANLARAAAELARLRGVGAETLAATLAANTRRWLGEP